MTNSVEQFKKEIMAKMTATKKYANVMRIPRLQKMVVNRGVSEVRENAKSLEVSARELMEITGQKPLVIKAKKSIAAFKIREGMEIGLKVTLRGRRMYDFYFKLVNLCLPKIRDFKGVSPKSFDGRGNYSLGIREQLVFPEVDYEGVDRVRGMDIIFVTSTDKDEEAKELLEVMGMPFRKEN